MSASIILDKVSLQFPIYDSHARSLKRSLLNISTRGRVGISAQHRVVVNGLSDISLRFSEGDRVALIGGNGAGKTTLLRLLAKVYEPTSGTFVREGRVGSLFDLFAGMDPESSGEENIFVRGMLMGLSKQAIRERLQGICDFADLGEFLSMPVRMYSSGMQVRLGFAVATAIDADILLMDEWISVGDAKFVEKAEARLMRLIGSTGILVIASHDFHLIRTICTKAVWLDGGKVAFAGPVDEAIERYLAAAQAA